MSEEHRGQLGPGVDEYLFVTNNSLLDRLVAGPEDVHGLRQLEDLVLGVSLAVGPECCVEELAGGQGHPVGEDAVRQPVELVLDRPQHIPHEICVPVPGERPTTAHVVHAQAQRVRHIRLVPDDR